MLAAIFKTGVCDPSWPCVVNAPMSEYISWNICFAERLLYRLGSPALRNGGWPLCLAGWMLREGRSCRTDPALESNGPIGTPCIRVSVAHRNRWLRSRKFFLGVSCSILREREGVVKCSREISLVAGEYWGMDKQSLLDWAHSG